MAQGCMDFLHDFDVSKARPHACQAVVDKHVGRCGNARMSYEDCQKDAAQQPAVESNAAYLFAVKKTVLHEGFSEVITFMQPSNYFYFHL